MKTEALAKFMHDQYESLAPIYGWETQESARTDFDKLPESNRKLMIDVAGRVLSHFEDRCDRVAIEYDEKMENEEPGEDKVSYARCAAIARRCKERLSTD